MTEIRTRVTMVEIHEDGTSTSRPATWQEQYGMQSKMHGPSTETVRYVKWLEQRITELEQKLEEHLTGSPD